MLPGCFSLLLYTNKNPDTLPLGWGAGLSVKAKEYIWIETYAQGFLDGEKTHTFK